MRLLLLLLMATTMASAQSLTRADIRISPIEGYNYTPVTTNQYQVGFENKIKNEILVLVIESDKGSVGDGVIENFLLGGNDIVQWEKATAPDIYKTTPKGNKIFVVSWKGSGLYGQRIGFDLKGKLVAITCFSSKQEDVATDCWAAYKHLIKEN